VRRELGAVDVEEFMDFSANINPFGPSPLATQAHKVQSAHDKALSGSRLH